MRMYKSDGTFTDNVYDTDFGWFCNEIIIDESVPNYKERNRERKTMAALRKNYRSFGDSFAIDLEDEIPKVIETIEPEVEIQLVTSCMESNLEPEGLISERLVFDDPNQQQLANLINPCNLETKMLLAVIHFAKYTSLEHGNNLSIGLNQLKHRKLGFFITPDMENDLKTQIEDYHATKEDNMLSLMMELILADMDMDLGKSTDNSSDLGHSVSDTESENDRSFNQKSFNSSGFSSVIDKSIGKICEETYDMHLQLREIHKAFKEQESKLNVLIKEAQTLRRNLRETKYLEDLLQLLNGNIENICPKNWPFRILCKESESELNLII